MSSMNFRVTGDREQKAVLERHMYAMEMDYRGHQVKLESFELQLQQAQEAGAPEEVLTEMAKAIEYAESSMSTIAEVHTRVSNEFDAIEVPTESTQS